MAKCDLCGGDCRASYLSQLLNQYQAAGVVDICPDCEKWANKLKGGMLDEIPPRMRAAIAAKKAAQPERPKLPWWRRMLGSICKDML